MRFAKSKLITFPQRVAHDFLLEVKNERARVAGIALLGEQQKQWLSRCQSGILEAIRKGPGTLGET